MLTKTQEEFIQLLRYEMTGAPLTGGPAAADGATQQQGFAISDEAELIKLAELHDLTHLIYDALAKNGISCSGNVPMQRYYAAIWRCEQMDHELEKLSALFAENGIDYIPLKGAVMRGMYPERWMRTSADIDILIHPEDVNKAEKLLTEELSYEPEEKSLTDSHHDNFHAPANNVHLELHKRLFDAIHEEKPYYTVFLDVWKKAVPDPKGSPHRYALKDDFFLLYHMAHMEKHVSDSGGIAVRGLIDLWLLNRMPEADTQARAATLKENGLSTFADRLSSLINSWMDGAPAENEDFEQYVLGGYMYGSTSRRIAIKTQNIGKSSYLLSRIFMPHEKLKTIYPVLQKHPVLTPVFEVVRWAERLTSKKTRNKGVGELHALKKIEVGSEEQAQLGELRRYLDLTE